MQFDYRTNLVLINARMREAEIIRRSIGAGHKFEKKGKSTLGVGILRAVQTLSTLGVIFVVLSVVT